MKVRKAVKDYDGLSWYSIATTLSFGILLTSFGAMGVSLAILLGISFVGILFLIYSFSVDHKAWNQRKRKKSIEQHGSGYTCKECRAPVREAVAFEEKDGVPILYHCKKCDVLWHVGNYVESQ